MEFESTSMLPLIASIVIGLFTLLGTYLTTKYQTRQAELAAEMKSDEMRDETEARLWKQAHDEIARYSAQIDTLSARINAQEQVISQLNDKIITLSRTLEVERYERQVRDKKISELEAEANRLRGENVKLKTRVRELEARVKGGTGPLEL